MPVCLDARMKFDFSCLKHATPAIYSLCTTENFVFQVRHKKSGRYYKIIKEGDSFELWATSGIDGNISQWEFVWRCDDLRRMMCALGLIG